MVEFEYKKWVTENKYGKLNEQTGSGNITGTPSLGTGSSNATTVDTNTSSPPSGCFYCDPYAYVQSQVLLYNSNSTPPTADYNPGYCTNNSTGFSQIAIQDPQNLFGPNASSFLVAYNSTVYNSLDQACAISASLIPQTGSGDLDTGEEEGSFGTAGNYTVFDYPNNWNPTNWTTNFVDMIINHPNPCNFLTQRITQFNTQLTTGNVGPLHANLLMQKIAVCQELYQIVGCGGINEQISGVKKYKLDPKAAAVIKKAAPKLKGLASRGRGVKKESKKISALKRIIKETLSELQEKQKECGCRNGVCKTAGGDLCPSHECGGACKGSESDRNRKDETAANRFKKAMLTKPERKDELYNIGNDQDYCAIDGDGIEGPLPQCTSCSSNPSCGSGCICIDGKTRYPKGIVGAKDGSMGKLVKNPKSEFLIYYREKRSMRETKGCTNCNK